VSRTFIIPRNISRFSLFTLRVSSRSNHDIYRDWHRGPASSFHPAALFPDIRLTATPTTPTTPTTRTTQTTQTIRTVIFPAALQPILRPKRPAFKGKERLPAAGASFPCISRSKLRILSVAKTLCGFGELGVRCLSGCRMTSESLIDLSRLHVLRQG